MTDATAPAPGATAPDAAARMPRLGQLTPAVALRTIDDATPDPSPTSGSPAVPMATRDLEASYASRVAVRAASLTFQPGRVTALVGPSGCGKSTLLRCLNRLHETVPSAAVRGAVEIGGADIYAPGTDPVAVRRRIGFVAQRPTPFPTMSIAENVASGLRLAGGATSAAEIAERVESVLTRTGLWSEVKDRLDGNPLALSGGQQQRLCLARALAPAPRVLLLDEPTSALDPASTQRIEELVYGLRGEVTVVAVTHNLQQAARISDHTVFMLEGSIIEAAPTRLLFTAPHDPRTEAFVTGRFG